MPLMKEGLTIQSKPVTEHIAVSVELILLILIEISGVILNGTVVLVIYFRYAFLRDKSRYLLLGNIIFCDCIVLFFIIPAAIQFVACKTKSCTEVLTEPASCVSIALLFEFSYICSFFTQASLAIDTLIRVRSPHSWYLKRPSYWCVLVLSWTVALTPTVIFLFPDMKGTMFSFSNEFRRCAHFNSSSCFYPIYVLVLVHVLFAPVIPGCYFYLALMAHNLRRRLLSKCESIHQPLPAVARIRSTGSEDDVSAREMQTISDLTRDRNSAVEHIRRMIMQTFGGKERQDNQPDPINPATPGLPQDAFSVKPQTRLTVTPRSFPNTPSPLSERDNSPYNPLSALPSMTTVTPATSSAEFVDLIGCSKSLNEISYQTSASLLVHDEAEPKPVLVHKYVQTSLSFTPASDLSSLYSSGESSLYIQKYRYEDPLESLSCKTLPRSQQDVTKWSNKFNLLNINSTRDSVVMPRRDRYNRLSSAPHRSNAQLWPIIAKTRARVSDASETKDAIRVRNPLSRAASKLCEHGLILMAALYGTSLPYALANSCPRLDLPFPFTTVAVILYYSTCIWHPIIYFFLSTNFRKQVSMTATGN